MTREEFFENHNIHEYSSEGEVIKDLFDMFEQKEATLSRHRIIDEIFDHFEQRVCENCQFWNKNKNSTYGICSGMYDYVYDYESNNTPTYETYFKFGCNKFKEKQCTLNQNN